MMTYTHWLILLLFINNMVIDVHNTQCTMYILNCTYLILLIHYIYVIMIMFVIINLNYKYKFSNYTYRILD